MRKLSEIIRDQNPLVLSPKTTIKAACQCMRQRKVGAVLVTDDERHLLGIFTGRDAIGRVIAEGKDAEATTLAEAMTPSPTIVSPERSAIDALRLMQDARCRHIPIVENGKVMGVVSRIDFRGSEVDRLDEETGLWERI